MEYTILNKFIRTDIRAELRKKYRRFDKKHNKWMSRSFEKKSKYN